ncbi:U1 small nuclear ribonucleoprotein C-like [Wolffia australiana]
MPRYYCDYCDTYLTHDSPSVRKQHNAGYKHKANVRQYYQQFEEQQTQSLIDQRIKEHLGQAAYQVGATYLASLPPNAQRPRLPVLPTPMMPMPGGSQPPFSAMRPPFLPRPMPGAPGYGGMPGMPYPGPHGPGSAGMLMNGPPRPPPLAPPSAGGSSAMPISPGGIQGFNPASYQSNPTAAGGGGYDFQDGPSPTSTPQDGGHHHFSQSSE